MARVKNQESSDDYGGFRKGHPCERGILVLVLGDSRDKVPQTGGLKKKTISSPSGG